MVREVFDGEIILQSDSSSKNTSVCADDLVALNFIARLRKFGWDVKARWRFSGGNMVFIKVGEDSWITSLSNDVHVQRITSATTADFVT